LYLPGKNLQIERALSHHTVDDSISAGLTAAAEFAKKKASVRVRARQTDRQYPNLFDIRDPSRLSSHQPWRAGQCVYPGMDRTSNL